MARHLFLASTPFNVITASMIALELPEEDEARLWLIDQPKKLSPFMQALPHWSMSPFAETRVVSYKARSVHERINRKSALREMTEAFLHYAPQHLYTGNDRRIEFQWLMGHADTRPTGHYLDDGTYTYLGRKTHWLSDKVFDNFLKKATYGRWWKQPSTIGASGWISEAHVAFPHEVVPALREKALKKLPENLNDPAFLDLMSGFDLHADKLMSADIIILVPHESVQDEQTLQAMKNVAQTGKNVLVKNHPRNTSIPESLTGYDQLPASLPMETLLPGINQHCRIIGDVSTALLTSKWLRPELAVTAFADGNNGLTPLMRQLGISVVNMKGNI